MMTFDGVSLRTYFHDEEGKVRYTRMTKYAPDASLGRPCYPSMEEAERQLASVEHVVPLEVVAAFLDYLEKNHGNY